MNLLALKGGVRPTVNKLRICLPERNGVGTPEAVREPASVFLRIGSTTWPNGGFSKEQDEGAQCQKGLVLG
jgi:hypothetical protein